MKNTHKEWSDSEAWIKEQKVETYGSQEFNNEDTVLQSLVQGWAACMINAFCMCFVQMFLHSLKKHIDIK